MATLANRAYCIDQASKYSSYGQDSWGLTASDGPFGYKAYGAPPTGSAVPILNDGTIAPTAAATSIMFTPPISLAAIKYMKEHYGDKIWGKYGFKDAFNPKQNWYSNIYLGLDEGPILIGIENYRTGLIWRLFMKNPEVRRGLEKAGFKSEITALHQSQKQSVEEFVSK